MRSGSGAIACGMKWSSTPSSLVANQIHPWCATSSGTGISGMPSTSP